MTSQEKIDSVLAQIKEHHIRVVDFWFVDILGRLKSISVPDMDRIKRLLEQGISCDIGAFYPDQLSASQPVTIYPDIDSFLILPWTDPKNPASHDLGEILQRNNKDISALTKCLPTARFFCGIQQDEDAKAIFSSRDFLRQQLETIQPRFDTFMVGPELEFHLYYLPNQPLGKKSYLDIEGDAELAANVREAIVLLCQSINFKVEYHHHEVGPGQQEINFYRDNAFVMADKILTYKALVKEVVKLFGLQASFMPKPFNNSQGNGMHVHQSLWKDGENCFHQTNMQYKLSRDARSFAAGLLTYASEITALTNQWVNSYKRIVPGFEAPVYMGWGPANRTTLIRIPRLSPTGAPDATRIEYRSPDPACNPYLAFAAMLKAGMEGINQDLELPKAIREDMYAMPMSEIKKKSIELLLPTNLGQALNEFSRSSLMKEFLGEDHHKRYLAIKSKEWNEFNQQITNFELEQVVFN